MHSNRRSLRPLVSIAFAALLVFSGCGGMKPNPKYNRNKTKKAVTTQKPSASKSKVTGKEYQPTHFDELDRFIQEWWGTPYDFGNETCQVGTDCSGYTQKAMLRLHGIEIERVSRDQYRQGIGIPKHQLRRGDLVFFHNDRGVINHVGIYLGDGRFTHSSGSHGVTVDSMDHTHYRSRYAGARRIGK